jgi:hypothetical protein
MYRDPNPNILAIDPLRRHHDGKILPLQLRLGTGRIG